MVSKPRTVAVLTFVPAIGFGLPGVYGAWHLHRRGEIWEFLGFPTYGRGPFEAVGVSATVPLLLGFVLVCAAEAVVGSMLWRRRRAAPRLAMLLLPFEFVFWVGFALPGGPIFGVARTAVIVFGGPEQPAESPGGGSVSER